MWSMGVKILLADDSPTVHKVIKIILKDESCEIIECAREAELSDKLSQHRPAVVFLDFNFSETQTGYDLCRTIKSRSPQSKILVMYGTFDTVDESALREAGAEQHVVKPFDTAKFIIQVRNLAGGMPHTPAPKKAEAPPVEDGWTIRESVERKTPDIGVMVNDTVVNFGEDLEQWGMMVPGVIGKSSGSPDLPPVIGEDSAPAIPKIELTLPKEAPKTDHQLPTADDLEYPDMTSGLTLELEPAPRSKLVSLNELVVEDTGRSESSVLLELSGMEDVEGDQRLADQIRDEVEEDLWSVDAFEDSQPKLSVVKEEEPSFSAINDGGQAFDDSLFEPLDKQDRAPVYGTALPADLEALRPLLKELVKEAVADYCRQHVEKVAWEVIPDLAENLIKNELRKISDQVSKNL
jgi:CheY-like chemotaxis protein